MVDEDDDEMAALVLSLPGEVADKLEGEDLNKSISVDADARKFMSFGL